MAGYSLKSSYWQGVAHAAPLILVVGPFSMLFGVLSAEAGLNLFEALSFSVVVIAGAAQFTALQLMQDHVPALIVLVTALTVNLRMAMYSAALTPHLGDLPLWKRAFCAYFLIDQTYALGAIEFERNPKRPAPMKFAYFAGTVTPLCPLWYVGTAIGATAGEAIPQSLALDFALPLAFLAMVGPALRTPAHMAAAFTATAASLALAWIPYNLGLFGAGFLGMAAGAEIERRFGA